MRTYIYTLLFLVVLSNCSEPAPVTSNKIEAVSDKEEINTALSQLIDSVVIEDQKYRNQWTEILNNDTQDEAKCQEIMEKWQKADAANQEFAKGVFAKYGYPGYSIVGQKSSHNFWLIVQHCDSDPAFQEKVLEAMKKEVDNRNAKAQDYAYLIDRVKVNTGQLQIYGTQMQLNKDSTSFEPQSLIEPEKVNERRKEVYLLPIEDYIKTMNEHYKGSLKQSK